MHLGRRTGYVFRCVCAAALLLVGSCTSASSGHDRRETTAGPSVTLSFLQYRSDEGTSRALLRVENHENRELVSTGIGVDWPGYGKHFRQPYDTTVGPRQTLDLRMTLPPPTCRRAHGPAFGLLELEDTTIRSELDDFGQAVIRQVWERACDEEYVDDRVGVFVDDDWRRAGSGQTSYLVGHLDLTRRNGDEEVRLPSLHGSVMFDLRPARAVVMDPAAATGSFPVELRPVRCDEHALGQSTQTFGWQADVRFGEARPRSVALHPGLRTQQQANALLRRACR